MKSSTIVICLVATAVFGAVIFAVHKQSVAERRILVYAVTNQIDNHSANIATLLTTMENSNISEIEDAAFHELRTVPSTSVISRSMIRVVPAGDGHLECIIDTKWQDLPPRTIRSSQ